MLEILAVQNCTVCSIWLSGGRQLVRLRATTTSPNAHDVRAAIGRVVLDTSTHWISVVSMDGLSDQIPTILCPVGWTHSISRTPMLAGIRHKFITGDITHQCNESHLLAHVLSCHPAALSSLFLPYPRLPILYHLLIHGPRSPSGDW